MGGWACVSLRALPPRQTPLCPLFGRQRKLEEELLFSGRFPDALQTLLDWLYRAEPQLAEEAPVAGDRDVVSALMEKHKVGGSTHSPSAVGEEGGGSGP